jgi:LPS export ABC transporter protein LptC
MKVQTLRIFPFTIILLLTVMLATSSCEEEVRTYVKNITDPDSVPTMTTIDVKTFISDSGYTRYRIIAPIWYVYDEAKDPHWNFPKGLQLKQYDPQFHETATVEADTAIYFSAKRIWKLNGNVVMVNTLRDSFLTQEVFWDQSRREVYSDSFIHIVRQSRIIEGYGFTSNETMTRFTVNIPTGIIPITDTRFGGSGTQAQQAAAAPADTADDSNANPRRRGAPVRASQRSNAFSFDPLTGQNNNAPIPSNDTKLQPQHRSLKRTQ